MNINNNINLAESFEKLLKDLQHANDHLKSTRPGKYAYASGYLSSAIKKHLLVCTDTTWDELPVSVDTGGKETRHYQLPSTY